MDNKEFGILLIKDLHEQFGGVISNGTVSGSKLVSHVDIWGANSWLIEWHPQNAILSIATREMRNGTPRAISIDYKNPHYLEIITELINKHKDFKK